MSSRLFFSFFTGLMVLVCHVVVTHAQSCPRAKSANEPGDILIGGLFNIHERGTGGDQCGPKINEEGVQRLEAFLFTVDKLNRENFVPRVKLGAVAFDTCGHELTASNRALEFLGRRQLNTQGQVCSNAPLFLGMVGDEYSGSTQEVTSVLTSARVSQISYGATATALGDKEKYPYFLRTVPSSTVVARVLLDILGELGWSDISLIVGDDADAQDRKSELLRLAGSRAICVTKVIEVTQEVHNIGQVVMDLMHVQKRGVTGVIVMTLPEATQRLFTGIQAAMISEPFLASLQWVMGMSFQNGPAYNRLKDTIKGLISISERSRHIQAFRNYFTQLNPTVYNRDPWFREYWEQKYNCTLCHNMSFDTHDGNYTSAKSTPCDINGTTANLTTEAPLRTTQLPLDMSSEKSVDTENVTDAPPEKVMVGPSASVSCGVPQIDLHQRSYVQAGHVSQVMSSVYTYAYALREARDHICGTTQGFCNDLALITPDRLMTYLRGTSFISMDSQVISFDQEGTLTEPAYTIHNVQLDGVGYRIQEVGEWTGQEGLIMSSTFKTYDIYSNITSTYPSSSCNYDCVCHNDFKDYKYGSMEGGDVLIHGVFDVHGPGSDVLECDNIVHGSSVQALEAMYYAVELINNVKDILPGVRLSVASTDSCRNPSRAVRQTTALLTSQLDIQSRDDRPLRVTAVLGSESSDVSLALAELLAVHKVPEISYGSSTSQLGDKSKYPYFMRTVGADEAQVQAMIDIIKEFGWTYVKVIYSNNAYGNAAAKYFLEKTNTEDICVATQVQLERYITEDKTAMRNIIRYYLMEAYVDAKVVVMFTTDTDARGVLEAVDSLLGNKVTSDLIWLASDYWGSRPSVVKGLERVASGAICLAFLADDVTGFMEYFHQLQPSTNSKNPWFDEFWQHYFECYLSSEFAKIFNTSCDPSRHSLQNEAVGMATQVPYVIDSVYTIALGLHHLIQDYCGANATDLCAEAQRNMDMLYDYMTDLRFYNSITNLTVSYDSLGNGIPRYSVLNYQRDPGGSHGYVQVGSWEDGKLSINTTAIQGPASANGSTVSAEQVASSCGHDDCMCTSVEIKNLDFELKYARLTLLGYFPIHETGPDGRACTKIRPKEGFEPLMAFKYAIQRVNNDPYLLPNVTLGYMVFDTCSDDEYAAMAFDSFDKNLRFFSKPPQLPVITYVHAFIGGFENDVSKALNKVSDTGQRLVQISPGSTADELSNREDYYYFLRTVAPESNLAHALVALIRAMGWTYMSIVHSTSQRDMDLADKLQTSILERGACIATTLPVPEGSDDPNLYNRVIEGLLEAKGALGVFVIAPPRQIRLLLEAAHAAGTGGKLVWVGTEQWGRNRKLMEGLDDVARGTMTLVPDTGTDPYFDAYMQRLTPHADPDNPWLAEYWQEYFQCDTVYGSGYPKVCTGLESLDNSSISMNTLSINTINAVYSYAYGLTRLFEERCGGMVMPPCDAVTGDSYKTSALVYDYIKRTRFTGADGKPFGFTDRGDGTGRYKVLNYKVELDHKPPADVNISANMEVEIIELPSGTGFIEIGEWSGGKLKFNKSLVHMYDPEGRRILPQSQCPGTCNCSSRQGYLDKENVPLSMHAHLKVWGVLIMTFALLGIVLAFVTMMFFIFKFRHPVVVGSTSSLSVLLLFGIIFLYLMNFAFMLSDTWATCGIRRFGLGFFYSIIFAVLFIKATRVGRICNKAALSSKPSFISGPSQTAIVVVLVSIELLLVAEWLIIQPPDVYWTLVNVNHHGRSPIFVVEWRCAHTREALVTSLCYVYFLITLALVFSIKARKAANYQHEALSILISTLISIVVLIIWTCVYLLAEDVYTIPAVCVGITVTASVIFGMLFLPKMLVLTSPRGVACADSTNNLDYDSEYAVPKRNRDNHTQGRTNPGFPITELSEQTVYNPYAGRQMASF